MDAKPSLLDVLETLAALKIPPASDKRLQLLMDRNNDGLLTGEEREELAGLVYWSEDLSLLRAQALLLLGRRPIGC